MGVAQRVRHGRRFLYTQGYSVLQRTDQLEKFNGLLQTLAVVELKLCLISIFDQQLQGREAVPAVSLDASGLGLDPHGRQGVRLAMSDSRRGWAAWG